MGYRLDIELKSHYDKAKEEHIYDDKPILSLGKLYGYCGEEEYYLKSCKYLRKLGLVEDDEYKYWGDGYYPDFEITPKQLKKFVRLYVKEYIKNWNFNKEDAKEFKENVYKTLNEILSYNENVILNWG